MEKFLNTILSALLLIIVIIGVICVFAFILVYFELCLPIILVSFLFLKTKKK